jgi:hypothetical protein
VHFGVEKSSRIDKNVPMDISGKYISRVREIRYKEMEARSVLLDLHSGSYYTLNELGNFIWGMLNGSRSTLQIVEAVTDAYEVDPDAATKDTEALIRHLMEEGLVRLHDEPQ